MEFFLENSNVNYFISFHITDVDTDDDEDDDDDDEKENEQDEGTIVPNTPTKNSQKQNNKLNGQNSKCDTLYLTGPCCPFYAGPNNAGGQE